MKTLTQFVVASAGLLVLTFASLLVNAPQVIGHSSPPDAVDAAGSPARLAPTLASPVATDYVTLEHDFGETGACEFGTATERILPDGTRAPFAVPRGRVLVLTDMQGVVIANYPAVWTNTHVGHLATLSAVIQGTGPLQYFEARAQVNAASVLAQIIPLEVHLQSGMVAGPGSIVCLRASLSKAMSSFTADSRARIHGYLLTTP